MATITATPTKSWGFFVDGKWVNSGEPFEVLAPHEHSVVVGTGYRATAQHAEAAVQAAQRAFEVTRKLPSYERQRVLRAIAEGIRERRDEFARVLALEAGKPIKTARVEVDRAIFTFSVAAEEALRITGEWLPLDWQPSTAGRSAIVRRFALGPILAITPFNFPLNLWRQSGTGDRGGLHNGAQAGSADAVVFIDAGRGDREPVGRRVLSTCCRFRMRMPKNLSPTTG